MLGKVRESFLARRILYTVYSVSWPCDRPPPPEGRHETKKEKLSGPYLGSVGPRAGRSVVDGAGGFFERRIQSPSPLSFLR